MLLAIGGPCAEQQNTTEQNKRGVRRGENDFTFCGTARGGTYSGARDMVADVHRVSKNLIAR